MYFNNYYDFWQRLVKDEQKINLFNLNVYNKVDKELPKEKFKRVFTFNENLKYNSPQDHINNSLYFESKTFLSSLFIVGDKLSVANGFGERFPFMDNDFVDFAMKIPIDFKLGNFRKEILKNNENTPSEKRLI